MAEYGAKEPHLERKASSLVGNQSGEVGSLTDVTIESSRMVRTQLLLAHYRYVLPNHTTGTMDSMLA